MRRFPRIAVSRVLTVALCLLSFFLCIWPASAQVSPRQTSVQQASVRQIRVLDSKNAVEIEVEASDRITPQTQVLTGPDRLVVDFPNAVPGSGLRSQSVLQGEVKDVRVGLFQANPPITRIVLDLKSAQAYQVFPGQTVIIKVMSGTSETAAADPSAPQTRPGLIAANYTTGAERISRATPPPSQIAMQSPAKPLDVWFRDGLLKIKSNKATLSEVLFAVQQRTGAEIGIVAGAEQEQVVVDLGPAPAPEVLSRLLNGSKFNFLIVSAPDNPRRLDRVILSQRNENLMVSRAPIPNNNVVNNNQAEEDEEAMRAAPPPPPQASQPNPTQPESHPEANNGTGDNPPQ
jgi:hypothetical protein